MRTIFILFLTLVSVMCYAQNSATADAGVEINGVRWATRNVDAPGRFVASPENSGLVFQWNRRQGWAITGRVESWNPSPAAGESWTRENDPCPQGWRVPTIEELHALNNAPSIWTERAGVNGVLFGTAPNQIFLPIAGIRGTHGALDTPGRLAYIWSSTPTDRNASMSLRLQQGWNSVVRAPRAGAFTIRCVAE